MAATVTIDASPRPPGHRRLSVSTVVFDNAYPTGGLAVTANQLGHNVVFYAESQVKVAGTGAVTAVFYDVANSKLKAFTASAEVANGVDLSAVTAQIVSFGN